MSQRLRSITVHAALTLAAVAAALFVFSWFGGAEITVGNLVLRAQHGTEYPLEEPPAEAFPPGGALDLALPPAEERPKNVILFVGDGMGVGHVSAAEALLHRPGSSLTMTGLETLGLMRSWAANNLVTDSAASATAIATGFKTDRMMVGLLPDGRRVRNLFEAARSRGMATGVVTTSGLVDATPACFTAHVRHRESYDLILEQMLDSGTDVMLGGDWTVYRKARKNRRYMEMIADVERLADSRGYSLVRDEDALAAARSPLLGLFAARPEDPAAHGPRLAVSLQKTFAILSANPGGFVMVVESEITDEAGHDNDIAGTMTGMHELDEAVALALRLTRTSDDTLLIVTADHDTGSLALVEGEYASGRAVVRWASGKHSTQMVPVFASGPGADHFAGILDNTELGRRIAGLLGLEPLPRLADSTQN